jgi:15-cis-phytoene synthase
MADDAIDTGLDPRAALQSLRGRLDAIYRGEPRDIPADRAFADVVHAHSIPKLFPAALLEGFEWDSLNRRYANLSELKAYGVKVAGTVGAMMAMIMDVRSRSLIARACDLGVAMQLTNIARDVGEDARLGRLYLPLDWMRAAGLDPERWLAEPRFDDKLSAVVERLLCAADELYGQAESGISQLPVSCRAGMYAARMLYADIGNELRRRNFDSVSQRAVVPWHRKVRVVADALIASQRSLGPVTDEAMPEAAELLSSIAEAGTPIGERGRWLGVEDRAIWVMDLFERLERRELAA